MNVWKLGLGLIVLGLLLWIGRKVMEVGFGIVIRLLDRWVDADDSDLQDDVACRARIAALSGEVAKERARTVLRDETRFLCEPSCGRHTEQVRQLAPLARELFSEFDSISTAGGEASVGPCWFHKTKRPDFLIVGGSEDCVAYLQLHPCSETVFEPKSPWTRGGSHEPDQLSPAYPTIYHWILTIDEIFLGNWGKEIGNHT